jgi:hypothetical protein
MEMGVEGTRWDNELSTLAGLQVSNPHHRGNLLSIYYAVVHGRAAARRD